jgi:hypothetical protein
MIQRPSGPRGSAVKKLLLVVALVLAACGGSDATDSPADDTTTTTEAEAAADSTTTAPETEETQPPTTEASSPSPGSAGIVLTIGDETWQFDGALCAFTGANPGQDGSEWNVSNVKDGAQVYVSEDSFGPLVQYADISNGGDPNFNWESVEDGLSISVAGNDITVTGDFTNSVGGAGPIAGTLGATCPGWVQG